LQETASSFARLRDWSLLQSAYSDYQIGAFENFHQLVRDERIFLRLRLQYELRFADRMKSQLLISHCFLLIKYKFSAPRRRKKNQVTF